MAERSVKSKWKKPGTTAEDAGPLRAFGVGRLPGARLSMTDPAVSKAQQRWAASCRHNPKHRGACPSPEVAREFAIGATKGLPERKRKKR